MMDVTVKVPVGRIAEFYAVHAAFLGESQTGSPGAVQPLRAVSPPLSILGGEADGRQPWTQVDAALAAKLWGKFSDAAKALFSQLIDEPNRRFTGQELAEMLDIPNGHSGVAGVLAWPGKWCKQASRQLLWKWGHPAPGQPVVYWMTPEDAALFREARDGEVA
jgi:hypothetical protein